MPATVRFLSSLECDWHKQIKNPGAFVPPFFILYILLFKSCPSGDHLRQQGDLAPLSLVPIL